MGKLSWILGIFLYLFVISTVANSIGMDASSVNVGIPEEPTGLLSGIGALGNIIGTFWKLLFFNVTGVPAWFTVLFVYPALFVFLWIIVSLARGVS